MSVIAIRGKTMSLDTDLIILVPRCRVAEFYNKYYNLVESFYCVTLSENKYWVEHENPDYVYFNVTFNLNPDDGSFNPQELVGRIQVCIEFLIFCLSTCFHCRLVCITKATE